MEMHPGALYIHIPFCTNKCYYCDFNSYIAKGQPIQAYLEALDREMALTVEQVPPGELETIFVGGGTPTVLNVGQMHEFLRAVARHFPAWSEQIEFTMEANPGTVDAEKLRVMKAGGVNRISFGAQSFDNRLLKVIGRIHESDDVTRSIDLAREAGIDNLSIDLMFGLPQQTVADHLASLQKALQLGLPHYSVYGLKVEENTLFYTLFQKGELPLPEEDDEYRMYVETIEMMKAHGYVHYEISNFAKPGYESRHNRVYWRNEPYYGVGAGAHGYVNEWRHVNRKGVKEYIAAVAEQGLPRLETYPVSRQESMENMMMVGLRLLEEGVSRERFRRRYNVAVEEVFIKQLRKLETAGLISLQQDRIKLSDKGLMFGNDVFAEFIS
jgi:oxygen-independent coproporphyrinogen-3 oxidase